MHDRIFQSCSPGRRRGKNYWANSHLSCSVFFWKGGGVLLLWTPQATVVVYIECLKLHLQIVVSLVNNRPSAQNFSYSDTLRDWTKATNIRLRFIRTKTLLGHLMAVARMDPTVTRRVSEKNWKNVVENFQGRTKGELANGTEFTLCPLENEANRNHCFWP